MGILTQLLQLDLFGFSGSDTLIAKKPRQASAGWEVADHACRHCLGRVLQRRYKGEVIEVRCAECGAHAEGGHAAICCCGAECGSAGYILECIRNTEKSKAVPQEIMVRERPMKEKPVEHRAAKPVGIKDF